MLPSHSVQSGENKSPGPLKTMRACTPAHPRRVGTNLQRRGAVCEHIQAILTRPTIEIHEHVDTEIVDGLGCSPSCVSPEMEETPSTRGVDLLLPRCRRTSEPLLVGVDAHSSCPR